MAALSRVAADGVGQKPLVITCGQKQSFLEGAASVKKVVMDLFFPLYAFVSELHLEAFLCQKR
jgi:hypothetical protein